MYTKSIGNNIIAYFNNRLPGSFFTQILKNPVDKCPGLVLRANHRLSSYDMEVQKEARRLKSAGTIDSYYTCTTSGRVIVKKGNTRMAINKYEDILSMFDSEPEEIVL